MLFTETSTTSWQHGPVSRPGLPASAALLYPSQERTAVTNSSHFHGCGFESQVPVFLGFCPGALASTRRPETVKDIDESLRNLRRPETFNQRLKLKSLMRHCRSGFCFCFSFWLTTHFHITVHALKSIENRSQKGVSRRLTPDRLTWRQPFPTEDECSYGSIPPQKITGINSSNEDKVLHGLKM